MGPTHSRGNFHSLFACHPLLSAPLPSGHSPATCSPRLLPGSPWASMPGRGAQPGWACTLHLVRAAASPLPRGRRARPRRVCRHLIWSCDRWGSATCLPGLDWGPELGAVLYVPLIGVLCPVGVSLLQGAKPPGLPAANKVPGEGWENPSGSHTAATCRSCSQAGSRGTQPGPRGNPGYHQAGRVGKPMGSFRPSSLASPWGLMRRRHRLLVAAPAGPAQLPVFKSNTKAAVASRARLVRSAGQLQSRDGFTLPPLVQGKTLRICSS